MSAEGEEKTVVAGSDPSPRPQAETASVAGDAPGGKLVCLNADDFSDLPEDFHIALRSGAEYVIGRDESCNICIKSRKLSRKHARIFPGIGRWGIEDLNSTNGIKVNGQRLESAWLKSGDEIGFGPARFRFELDRPELAGRAPSRAEATPGEASAEKTMIVGSKAASEAVLNAVRTAETEEDPEVVEEKTPAAGRARPRAAAAVAAPSRGKGWVWLIAALVVVAIAIAQAAYFIYPQYQRSQEIELLLGEGKRHITDIVDNERGKTTAQMFKGDYEDELVALAGMALKVERRLRENPGNVQLSNLLAKLAFLQFEREFIMALDKRDVEAASGLASRAMEKIQAIADQIPAASREGAIEDVLNAAELAKYAGILLQFRKFGFDYPEASQTAAAKPTPTVIAGIQKLKSMSVHYRRTYNRTLSVLYVVMKSIVDDVYNHDIELINNWKDILSNPS